MTLVYQSTRDANNTVTASQAILQGLATDGGLFTPLTYPKVDLDFDKLKDASYQEVAKLVLSAFLDDFTAEELDYCINNAYDSKFDTPAIAPLVKLDGQYNLELFHGSTIASKVQELQMTTQTGDNTHVIAIDGNFDDAQTNVKHMFNDVVLRERLAANKLQFSSANSMNIGRLVPQIVYYVYAYAQLVKSGEIVAGDKVNFTVPTGNFGNILAAFYAKQIGLPVGKLICASNDNNVLTDFFNTRIYDKKREFKITTSPSMDILVSSNLERLIFHLLGNNAEKTAELMNTLNTQGQYELTDFDAVILDLFAAEYATEEETAAEIKRVYESDSYIEDPHTAVASAVYKKYQAATGDVTKTVIASTASPYKFPVVAVEAVTGKAGLTDFEALAQLHEISGVAVPPAVDGLETAPVRHKTTVAAADMQAAVEDYLGL